MRKETLHPLEGKAEAAAEGLKALAHPTRLLAVCHIGDKERSVSELEEFLGTTQSNVSQHLAKLRDKGILSTRKDGNQVYYRIGDRKVLDLIQALQALYCP
jgi:DNA-binding transcriptional ArsR family regulator